MREAVADIRRFNKGYDAVMQLPDDVPVKDVYDYILTLPLPEGEGLVFKRRDQVERSWMKVKRSDTFDLEVADLLSRRPDKYAHTMVETKYKSDLSVEGHL